MSKASGHDALATNDGRPTIQELYGDGAFAQAARRWWMREKPAKFTPSVLKTEFYDALEKEKFGFKALLILENLQFLERYEALRVELLDSSLTVSQVLMAELFGRCVRHSHHLGSVDHQRQAPGRRAGVGYVTSQSEPEAWLTYVTDHLSSPPSNFSILFRRILSMCIDQTLQLSIRLHLLSFIVTAFQSLDSGLVRKECASLVSIAIWNNLSSENVRNVQLDRYPQTRKAWRAAGKRYDAADETTKVRLRFERSWLYQMILNFLNLMLKPVAADDPTRRLNTPVVCAVPLTMYQKLWRTVSDSLNCSQI
jgi:intron-binding protein aquarius